MNRKEEILAIIRQILTAVGTSGVVLNFVDSTVVDSVVGALVVLVSAVWSVVDKTKTRALIQGLSSEG